MPDRPALSRRFAIDRGQPLRSRPSCRRRGRARSGRPFAVVDDDHAVSRPAAHKRHGRPRILRQVFRQAPAGHLNLHTVGIGNRPGERRIRLRSESAPLQLRFHPAPIVVVDHEPVVVAIRLVASRNK